MRDLKKKIKAAIDYKNTNHPFSMNGERAQELEKAATSIEALMKEDSIAFAEYAGISQYVFDGVIWTDMFDVNEKKTTAELYSLYIIEQQKVK